MSTLEQQARDLLERMEVPNAQSMTAGELVELANLMGARNAALEEAAKVCEVISAEFVDDGFIYAADKIRALKT